MTRLRRLPPFDSDHTCPDCGGYVRRGACLACGRSVRPLVRVRFADGTTAFVTGPELMRLRGGR